MNTTPFCAASESDVMQMLAALNLDDLEKLFSQIPRHLQSDSFDLSPGLSEMEMLQKVRKIASKNATNLLNFCGGGFYDHFIPAAVDALAGRSEFYTAYTPYQPEASQGTLQAAFEYQTAICRLTGMEAANASMYDGGTALFEGMMMALRCTRRNKVLIDQGVSPIYRAMLRCYTQNLSIEYEEIPLGADGLVDLDAFKNRLDTDVGAILVQNPNFFGCVDDFTEMVAAAHAVNALAVVSVYPIALGLVKTPGDMGADIVVGEGQSLGLPLNFGGPYNGFMATTKKRVRKMPGRIVGETVDGQGRRGYVLTLQAREQHIRREKATSNICSNAQLCATRSIIYMSLLGKRGLCDLAELCLDRAGYAERKLTAIDGVDRVYDQPFFNEFAIRLPRNASEVVSDLIEEGIAAGFPVGRYYAGMADVLLVACTEKRTKCEIDMLAAKLEQVL